ncbi:hypothetical protein Dimus_001345, partial [Dionaea muscipula]
PACLFSSVSLLPMPKGKGRKLRSSTRLPIVAGTSPKLCDLEDSQPLDPVADDGDLISEKEGRLSPVDDADSFTDSMDEENEGLTIKSEPHPSHSGVPIPLVELQFGGDLCQPGSSQVCPNLPQSSVSTDSFISLNSKIFVPDATLSSKLVERKEDFPSSTVHQVSSAIDVNSESRPPGNFNGQWSHLFAENCKPVDDFILKKVDFCPTDGCIDFSDEALAG